MELQKRGYKMLVLVGPSASGKTEVAKLLISKYHMRKLVTYTSRSVRVGEVDGRDYHFIGVREFERRIEANFFLEYVNYNGNYYGTAKVDLDSDKVLIVEPDGLKAYCRLAKDRIKICYLRCPPVVREERMRRRGDAEASISKRLENDDVIFNPHIEALADWVIDSVDISVSDMTELIFNLYAHYIKDE